MAEAVNLSISEWLCVLVILFATFSLQSSNETIEVEQSTELEHMSGVIELSTRSAMDAFGLSEFKVGAIASLNLTSQTVTAEPCDGCSNQLKGIEMFGDVVITNLLDSNNRQGRIEATIHFTHLYELSSSSFIVHEWFIIDWDSGDSNSSVEMYIHHNPPRWFPESSSLSSSFVEIDDGYMSRSGSEVVVQDSQDNTQLIRACLPDSFLCRASSPDAVLVAKYGPLKPPAVVQTPHEWLQQNHTNVSGIPEDSSFAQELMLLGEEVNTTVAWCPAQFTQEISAVSYHHIEQNVSLAPLSALLFATASIQPLFTPSGETWTETEFENIHCSSLVSPDGNLNFGIYLKSSV